MLALYLFALGAMFIAVACCAFCAAERFAPRGIIHCFPETPRRKTPMTYQGKTVTVVRDARAGDDGFDPKKQQSLIKLADGSNRVVEKSEVTA